MRFQCAASLKRAKLPGQTLASVRRLSDPTFRWDLLLSLALQGKKGAWAELCDWCATVTPATPARADLGRLGDCLQLLRSTPAGPATPLRALLRSLALDAISAPGLRSRHDPAVRRFLVRALVELAPDEEGARRFAFAQLRGKWRREGPRVPPEIWRRAERFFDEQGLPWTTRFVFWKELTRKVYCPGRRFDTPAERSLLRGLVAAFAPHRGERRGDPEVCDAAAVLRFCRGRLRRGPTTPRGLA